MPEPKKSYLRVLVPLVVLLGGIGVAVAVFQSSRLTGGGKSTAGTAQSPAGATGSTGPAAPTGATGTTVKAEAAPAQPEKPAQPTTPLGDLRAQVFENDPTTREFAPIGSLDEKGNLKARIEFSTLGAGIKSVRLADHFDSIRHDTHTAVQTEHVHTPGPGPDGAPSGSEIVVPMAADSVEIDGKVVSLLGYFDDPAKGVVGSPVWRQVAPGSFEAFVVDESGKRVARVERTYSLTPGSYLIRVSQKVENLSGQEIKVRWFQFGPVDLEQDSASYGGDKRRARFGYLLNAQAQMRDETVSSKDFLWSRADSHVMGAMETLVRADGSRVQVYPTVKTVWPNDVSTKYGYRPVWAGLTNRYFGAAMLPLVAPEAGPDQKEMKVASTVDRILLHRWLVVRGEVKYEPVMIFRTTSVPMTVAAGAAADLSVGFYAGPLSRPEIVKDAQAAAAGLRGLVVYNFGGACGFCTFPFLTGALLWLLRFLHGYIVFDWGLAIIVLVLVVRTILHPVTKWSQIRMQRFGKQMQAMAPKQKKIQEKFGNDPQKLREEMGKLWREEGVSPTGMLGCIPMFLQTPVWIALYATLYFAIELRHEGAFFGVFQKVSGGKWWFLGDLAEPDRFIYFEKTLVTLPILGPISSINILPAILGVVFFIQQKYLTPPTTGTMTPEQEQQQKIMKWMMVFMFPVMMYSSPSGLALYFIANSTLGILESRYIRSHIDKYDLMAAKKPAGGKPGFLARLQQIAEERQRQMAGRGGQSPRKRV